jgi:hypothetical protein
MTIAGRNACRPFLIIEKQFPEKQYKKYRPVLTAERSANGATLVLQHKDCMLPLLVRDVSNGIPRALLGETAGDAGCRETTGHGRPRTIGKGRTLLRFAPEYY